MIAFGPIAEGWGSWAWVGADMARELSRYYTTLCFPAWELPEADAIVLVKHAPPPGWVEAAGRRSAVLYAPVDRYGSAAEIDADFTLLRRCARVLVHCERLARYFRPYAPVEYIDHHVKFAAPLRERFRPDGDLLWVGVRSNLEPLVAWVNEHSLPLPLTVLTNLEDPQDTDPGATGFHPGLEVTVLNWSPERQVELTASARGFLDIKGQDFRSRHKPPAKGIDAIASGVPLAMNADSSTSEHLARLGFEVASPLDVDHWLSEGYWEETRRFGSALRELLSLERIGRRYKRVIDGVLGERRSD